MPGPGTWSPGDILTADDLNAIGVWTSYTPTVTQGVTVTATVNYASYVKINDLILANIDLTCTTSGTASTLITVSLPVDAVPNTGTIGSGLVFDSSGNDVILVTAARQSATALLLRSEATTNLSTSQALGNNPAFQLANGDVISLTLLYAEL